MEQSDVSRPPVGDSRDPGTLLLATRPGDPVADRFCEEHLLPHEDHEPASLAVVTDRPVADLPARPHSAVLVVGDGTRSAAGSTAPAEPVPVPDGSESVLATGDLGSAGRSVDAFLTSRAAAERRPAVCVDSLAHLIEETSVRATYRFLYVMLRRVEAVGGVAHAHADPRDHEEEILRTFHSLFDRVVSVRSDGAQ